MPGNTTFANVHIFGMLLQFAVTIPLAIQTIVGMISQQQFDNGLSGQNYTRRVCFYFHPLFHLKGTGGDKHVASFEFNHTQAAHTRGNELLHAAKRGHFNPNTIEHFEYGFTALNLYRFIVYFNFKGHILLYKDCIEFTGIDTFATAYAQILYNVVGRTQRTFNCLHRTFGRTNSTTCACFRTYGIRS